MSKKKTNLEVVCDKKLDEIAKEIEATNCASERIEILTKNADLLKKAKKQDPKGFKNWIKQIDASDVMKMSFSILMFVIVLFGENIGHMISSRSLNFTPWGKTPLK